MAASLLLNARTPTRSGSASFGAMAGVRGRDARGGSTSWRPPRAPTHVGQPCGRGPTGRRSASSPGSARRDEEATRAPVQQVGVLRAARSPRPTIEALVAHLRAAPPAARASSTSRPGAAPTRASRARPPRSPTATRASCSSTRSSSSPRAGGGPAAARDWLDPLVGARAPVRDRRRLPELPRSRPRRLGRRVPRRQPRAAARGQAPVRPGRRLRLSALRSQHRRPQPHPLASAGRAAGRGRTGARRPGAPRGWRATIIDRAVRALDGGRLGVAPHDRERRGVLRRGHGQPDRAPRAAEVARRRLGLGAAELAAAPRARRRRRSRRAASSAPARRSGRAARWRAGARRSPRRRGTPGCTRTGPRGRAPNGSSVSADRALQRVGVLRCSR